MIYFAAVSFAEIRQRVMKDNEFAWSGFLGVGDATLGGLPRQPAAACGMSARPPIGGPSLIG